MNRTLQILATLLVLVAAAPLSRSALPPPNTEWEGVITAITPTSITVQSPKGTRAFVIYPGTVFGQRAAKKITDFKTGDKAKVVYSTVGAQVKAENVRNPDDDKKPAPKKPNPAAKK